jgi:hypothetical protein
MIEYEFEDLVFEFTPEGSTRGYLVVIKGETTFGERVDIAAPKGRATFVAHAHELYPEAFTDELTIKRALNELSIHVTDKAKIAEAAAEEEEEEENVDEVDGAGELISMPNVLERYVEDMAAVHEVYEDRAQMKVVTLGALSAQLEPPTEGKPVGTNVVVIGDAGRGKNYVADAAASGLPRSFVYEFESASAKSFYYQAAANPEKFKHTWVYPNEAEATDQLIETLRPLLSKGSAKHATVDDNADGKNVSRELEIEGPITATIPTVRNKLDHQLQTRMLVVELEEFENRVSEHSAKVSDTLTPDYAAQDHAEVLRSWRAALSKLTEVRRVVIPGKHEKFRLTSNDVPHGARLWRNFLSLMLANAWLEQRNREIRTLENGTQAVVATAEDYAVAYEIFRTACERSVVSLGETHRKILNALYELKKDGKKGRLHGKGFSLRQIGQVAGVTYETVRKHKTYLAQSVGLMRELENGSLDLVQDAEPSWWKHGEFLKGFPRPDEVKVWWEALKGVDTVDSDAPDGENRIDTPNEPSTEGVDNPVDAPIPWLTVEPAVNDEVDTSTPLSTTEVDSEFPIDTPNTDENGGVSTLSTPFESSDDTKKKGRLRFGEYEHNS